MPLKLNEIKDLKIAELREQRAGGVDWDGLFDSLCELGFGSDNSGFSVSDAHLMTRQFATVEYPKDGYPISRQRVYRKMMDWWKALHALRFMHSNAKDYRFAFQADRLDPEDERISEFIYHGD
ncbi:hypothetical protein KAR91_87930 [Candidatus Pacearchaeota archaeon]|nr:hypothetical protein [Candidatus Pacearchaeota archaeon]